MFYLGAIFAFTLLFTSIYSQTYEGDLCQDANRESSVCRKLSNCPSAQEAIREGQYPKICSFDGLLPIVCCPKSQRPPFQQSTTRRPSNSQTTRRPTNWQTTQRPSNWQTTQRLTTRRTPRPSQSKAKKMCKKYAEHVFRIVENPSILPGDSDFEKLDECGMVIEALIVGGQNASAKEFPHMAHIGYGEEPRISYHCGGSLISERFIMSAAHCTKTPKGLAKWARLGDLNVASDSDGLRPIVVRITQRYNHPEYDSVKLYNDVSLFKLEKDVRLSPDIRPLCLQTEHSITSRDAIATGWGHTSWGGSSSAVLKKVTLNIVDTTTCNESFWGNIGRQLPNGIVDQQMVCAGDEIGKDACQGDSGGPLQIALKEPYCMYAQIGVTSFGKACGQDSPGVYTRVSHYLPWIESIVWP